MLAGEEQMFVVDKTTPLLVDILMYYSDVKN